MNNSHPSDPIGRNRRKRASRPPATPNVAHDTLFLDCEFTELDRPQLLSLGLCSHAGAEFYREYDLTGEHGQRMVALANDFVRDDVLPLLGRRLGDAVHTKQEFGDQLFAWLVALRAPMYVAYDYGWDFELMERVLHESGHWYKLKPLLIPTHVGYLWGAQAALDAAEQSWKHDALTHDLPRHHALSDARALRAAYLAVHGAD